MENATKALLIAAAVLIVIVLIALGVSLLNSGKDTSTQAKSTAEAISSQTTSATETATPNLQSITMNKVQKFNMQFEKYFGKNVSAEKACKLIDIIVENYQKSDHIVFVVVQDARSGTIQTKISIHSMNWSKEYVISKGEDVKKCINNYSKFDIHATNGCSYFKTNYRLCK